MRKKLVQFGAGSIGRSFIGQLFARGGYEVVFIDLDAQLVEALNREKQYRVVIKKPDAPDETILVGPVRAVEARDRASVADEIADASLIGTSVGQNALAGVLPLIAKGLAQRNQGPAGRGPIDVLIAENVRNAAPLFRRQLADRLGPAFPLAQTVGLVETSIGKMVPIMRAKDLAQDPLWVFAEAYNTLIVDATGFLAGVPPIEGILAVANIAAYVDRKLFIHNLGHSAAAYLGYRHDPRFQYIWQALEAPAVLSRVRACMGQAAAALHRQYPQDLSVAALEEHITDLLGRFRNRALGDTLFRVGRDLPRKLAKDDRIVGAALLAARHDLPFDAMAEVYRAACSFRATDEDAALFPQDAVFHRQYANLRDIVRQASALSTKDPIEKRVILRIL